MFVIAITEKALFGRTSSRNRLSMCLIDIVDVFNSKLGRVLLAKGFIVAVSQSAVEVMHTAYHE